MRKVAISTEQRIGTYPSGRVLENLSIYQMDERGPNTFPDSSTRGAPKDTEILLNEVLEKEI